MQPQFMVGRQPIVDDHLDVYGYELLFRGERAAQLSGDAMTADVLVHSGLDIGLDRLVGDKPAFVNATRAFLVGERHIPWPPDRVVIEVLEGIKHDAELLAGCRRLVADGYRLALDDYVWSDTDGPMLEMASIVKLDLRVVSPPDLPRQVELCSTYGALLVAEKVETAEELDWCRELKFDLYQGYLLSRPELVGGGVVPPNRLTCLQLVNRLCDPDTSIGDIARLVESDPGLSHRFLRAAGNGAAAGLHRRVNSIREAVVLLGWRRLRSWVILMLVADARRNVEEQFVMALVRARMCELMAAILVPRQMDSAFTVGLVSALDFLLGVPLAQIVEHLSIGEELVGALVDRTGRLGAILSDVLAWEAGPETVRLQSKLDPRSVERSYLDALAWATRIGAAVEDSLGDPEWSTAPLF